MSLIFKNHSLAEVIYMLIRFNKATSFLWNAKNTYRNCVNEQKTDTPHTGKDGIGKGQCGNKWYLLFRTTHILPTPPFLLESSELPFPFIWKI